MQRLLETDEKRRRAYAVLVALLEDISLEELHQMIELLEKEEQSK